MRRIILLLAILCLFGCTSNDVQQVPEKEIITVVNVELGQKNTGVKPIILINDGEDSLYLGEKDYEFDVEGYSDNGKVEIIFDDSNVDFEKEGTYEVNVFAKDIFDENTDITNLILKKKVVKSTSNESVTNNSISNNSNGCHLTWAGVFCSWEDFLAYADYEHSRGMLSDDTWEGIHAQGGFSTPPMN